MAHRKQPYLPGGLLIVHPGALGDVVAMFGLIAGLRLSFERVTLVCRASVGLLAESVDLVDRCVAMETSWWSALYRNDPDERVRSFLARHQQVVLFSVNRDLEQIIHDCVPVPCLRVPPRPPVGKPIHVTRFAAKYLSENGLIDQIPSQQMAVCRHSPFGKISAVRNRQAPVLLHPGAGSPRKRWPFSAFVEVGTEIIANGGRAELVIGPAERDLLDEAGASGLKLNSLVEMTALLRLLSTAGGFIGNDAGVAHLAACLGLPTVVIFTASDPRRWKPNGPAVAALSPALSCRPCFETRDANCPLPVCQDAIAPRMVLQSYNSLINR